MKKWLTILILFTGVSCAQKVRVSEPISRGCQQPASGLASWYGPGFQGKPVSCQPSQLPKNAKHLHYYDQNALTAAHKTLKCGSLVRVTYKGKSVVVMITDSGPYVEDRVIDLSHAAAKRIGLKKSGVAPVQLKLISC